MVIYVSPGDVAFMRTQLDSTVLIVEFQVDDLWMRDTSCIFAYSNCNNYTDCVGMYGQPVNHSWPSAPLSCVDFNFNGWGDKQAHANDAKVAAHVASFSGATYVNSSLVMEGGSVEVDGEGTAIITRSSVINPNRNPGWTEAHVENELYTTLGIEKVIWTDGIIGRDITDAHIDFYARFTSPGVVVAARENDATIYDYNVTRQVISDLQAARDARGRQPTVHILDNPATLLRSSLCEGDTFFVCLIERVTSQSFKLRHTSNASLKTQNPKPMLLSPSNKSLQPETPQTLNPSSLSPSRKRIPELKTLKTRNPETKSRKL